MSKLKLRKEDEIILKKTVKFYSVVQIIGFFSFFLSIINWWLELGYLSNWFILYSFLIYLFGAVLGMELSLIEVEEHETDYPAN